MRGIFDRPVLHMKQRILIATMVVAAFLAGWLSSNIKSADAQTRFSSARDDLTLNRYVITDTKAGTFYYHTDNIKATYRWDLSIDPDGGWRRTEFYKPD